MVPDDSAITLLEGLVQQGEKAGASDIHLQMHGKSAQTCLRLDGLMTPAAILGEDVAERVFGRIKYLARLKTYQESLPQEGRIEKADLGSCHDVRVATYPTVTGEKIVLRLFTQAALPLVELGLPAAAKDELEKFLQRAAGLLLLTGPAGSGKTTTIYSCLQSLAHAGGRHVITVEDPVEQIIPGIMQTEVNEARGLTFDKAARHLLRQDPQVIVLGEIRDDETANIAVRAALTGHQVISTLHAGSCQGVVERLLVMCRDRHAVIEALELILNQRLLRKVCRTCAGKGCEQCFKTGYHGRLPAVEWVRVSAGMRADLHARGPAAVIPAQTLAQSARELITSGLSNEEELRRVIGL